MNTGFMDKIIGGTRQAFSGSLEIFKALGSLFTGFSLDKLGGPVMMYQLSSEAANQGVTTVISLMALLSMNLESSICFRFLLRWREISLEYF